MVGLEVGDVIKFLFEFNERIWEGGGFEDVRQLPELNFLFSDAFVPTWWTQSPSKIPLLTGWLAGPVVRTIRKDDRTLLAEAKQSLSYLFDCRESRLEKEIRVARVFNWASDPYSIGGYAYKTLDTASAIEIFATPVSETLYFAGEALNQGPNMGTVEAALESGIAAAAKMLS
jgi:monoamine oxidase